MARAQGDSALSGELTTVKSDVASLKTDVAALRRDLTALRTEFGAKITEVSLPYRGKTNTPGYVPHVAAEVARVKGLPVEAVAEATTANFHRLFSRVVAPP